LCCLSTLSPTEVPQEDRLMETDGLGDANLWMKNNEFLRIEVKSSTLSPTKVVEEVLLTERNNHHHRQGSNQIPKHMDSLSELENFSEPGDIGLKDNSVDERGGLFELEVDGSTNDSISSLFHDPFVMNDIEDRMIVEKLEFTARDVQNSQHQRKSSMQIGPQVEVLEVFGAGNPAVNGVYRYFAAHERFVMFTDEGQYQIIRGANLSEYGDRYSDCWVLEEIKKNVVRLYALASSEIVPISSEGWICIYGASPAPKVCGLDEGKLNERNGYSGNEDSDAPLSPLSATHLPKQWHSNDLAELDGVEWVA